MRITRLRIENFRRFRAPVEIADLDAGLNLFAGPNEAGKSTIATAIRAAFLERSKTGTLDALRPWGDASASPSVEVDFEFGGTKHSLSKSFLGRKRCQLTIGRRQMEGSEAEDHLAEIIGCTMSDRGGARADTLGIPGLLWIEQGTSHDLATPLDNARGRLEAALRTQFGGLATTGGDRLMDRIAEARNALLTEKTDRPRGDHEKAIKARDELLAHKDGLARKIQTYRETVDRLGDSRRALARLEDDRPWETLRGQERIARDRLEAGKQVEARRDAQSQIAASAGQRAEILSEQLAAYAKEDAVATQRRADLAAAEDAATLARAAAAQAAARLADADIAAQAASAALSRARDAQTRRIAQTRESGIATELGRLVQERGHAQSEQDKIVALRTRAAGIAIAAPVLARMEELSTELRDGRVRRDAIATSLAVDLLPGRTITIAGQTVTGTVQITVAKPVAIDLPQTGTLTITPGGADLPELGAQIAGLEDELRALLAGIGAPDADAARHRADEARGLRADIATAEKLLAVHAPRGIAALDADIAALRADLETARADLARLPAATPADEPVLPLADAEDAEARTRAALATAAAELHAARNAETAAVTKAGQAMTEWRSAKALIEAPARAAQKDSRAQELETATGEARGARAALEALDAELLALDLETIARDIARFEASAKAAETERQTLREAVIRMETSLVADGAEGLEEQHSVTLRDLGHAERRVAEFSRRAAALDLILGLMREKRTELARRILAPLQDRLDRYLRMALPGLAVELDETLAPAIIQRATAGGASGGTLDEYSVGAREQLGILLRLAYADLLKQAGRPTLVILDDALVHTDQDRLAGMKRVLYDAAARHQFLIFTCHPEAWRDLGVAARPVPA